MMVHKPKTKSADMFKCQHTGDQHTPCKTPAEIIMKSENKSYDKINGGSPTS
jgi:hypothetical protein